ncbi:unnamed protein product [Pieris macdunnoughi]|uniref:Uncharacterized protein n=1 Tax=Pieris macdunnoughi TaxID=345717 RepID=A0A821S8Z0_9NEOP|nr:unnamed protein product [Pieris macdunnoughi]
MKWLIFVYVCMLTQSIKCMAETIDVFEFGNNVGSVAFSKSGNIGLLEKNVKIPIILPKCTELSYVRVSVDNRRGPPKVDFDSEVNTVIIKYRPLQYSRSSYTVVAKSVDDNDCE